MKSPLDKVQDLISLALDSGPDQEEARNAAMSAVRLIRKYDLLVSPVEVGKVRRNPGLAAQKTQRLLLMLSLRSLPLHPYVVHLSPLVFQHSEWCVMPQSGQVTTEAPGLIGV